MPFNSDYKNQYLFWEIILKYEFNHLPSTPGLLLLEYWFHQPEFRLVNNYLNGFSEGIPTGKTEYPQALLKSVH